MTSRIGIIASPETAGVYRHAILTGFFMDATVEDAFPPANRIVATLLSWEGTGLSSAIVHEDSYREEVGEALELYYSLSPRPLHVILAAARTRRADDAQLASLSAAGIAGIIGSWTERPAAELKRILTAVQADTSTRLRQAARTQTPKTTSAPRAETGAVDDGIVNDCIIQGSFDDCVQKWKHGGACDLAWCPLAAAAPADRDEAAAAAIVYDEPEPEQYTFPGALVPVYRTIARATEPGSDGQPDEDEITIDIEEPEDADYIVRDLVLYVIQAHTAPDAPTAEVRFAPEQPGRRSDRNVILHLRARSFASTLKDVLISVIVSLIASFILTMFFNPTMGAFEVLSLFRDRALDILRFLGLSV